MPSIFKPDDQKSLRVKESNGRIVNQSFFSFRQVAAKFMVEDDEEQMKEELKEAFRIYDKEVTKA